jgi:cation-transporting ATPase F
VPSEGSALHSSLLAGALCSDAAAVPENGTFEVRGDPTEVALVVAAAKAGLYKDELEERLPRVAQIPFDPELRYSATFNDTSGRRLLVFVLGAPEDVLPMCELAYGGTRLERERMLAQAHRLATQGLRVLATAVGDAPRDVVDEERSLSLPPLAFSGLLGMIDPPRQGVKEAVRGCQQAGIRVLMITGDHAATALAIGRTLGIAEPGSVAVTGAELERLDDEELEALLAETAVFARVSPEHKYRIVLALQRSGETVAVTGDGVNDAPALRAADIGAAMGRSGTDVATEAADMVVSDDNFATIYAAVEEGRVAFDNVRKTTYYLVSSGVGEVLTVLASLAFRFQLPFLPAQLLWINLVTNGVQDVALAFEPGEEDLKRRRPRPRDEGVISSLLWERTVIAGAVMATGTIGLFLLELDNGIEYARSVAVTTMVLFQIFHVGNSRSEYLSAFRKSPFSNRFLFVGTAAALGLQIAALHLPFTQYVFEFEPLGPRAWLEIAAVAASVIVAVEFHKLIRNPGGWRGAPRASASGGETAG